MCTRSSKRFRPATIYLLSSSPELSITLSYPFVKLLPRKSRHPTKRTQKSPYSFGKILTIRCGPPMANSATELSNLNIQTPTSERPFSMITTATPAALSSTKLLSDAAGFDRPLSPRKRRRSSKPSLSSTNRETRTSTAASLSDKAAVHPEFRPPYLTGAAAIADEQMAKEKEAQHQARQISPNPARKVIGSLLAAQINPMSSAHDAPSAPKDSHQFLTEVAPSIKIAHGPNDEADMRMSPRSLSGSRTIDNAPQTAITANSASLASPGS